jgi:energy-coupling factor transport system substrate-specific component
MFTEHKRKGYIFFISVGMNFVLFLLVQILNLPLWLDTVGTMYISISLGFLPGVLVGAINNIFLSLFFFGESSIF